MKRPPSRMEASAVLLLKQALAPTAQVRPGQDSTAVAVVELKGGKRLSLDLKTWTEGATNRRHPGNIVWVVPRATPGLRERFRRAQESYVDLAERYFCPFLTFSWTGRACSLQRRPTTSRSFDPFADRSILILRTVMDPLHADRDWGVRELADALLRDI